MRLQESLAQCNFKNRGVLILHFSSIALTSLHRLVVYWTDDLALSRHPEPELLIIVVGWGGSGGGAEAQTRRARTLLLRGAQTMPFLFICTRGMDRHAT